MQKIRTWDIWLLEPDQETNGKTLEPVVYGLRLPKGEAEALVRSLQKRVNPFTKQGNSVMAGRSGDFDLDGARMDPKCRIGDAVPEKSGRALMLSKRELIRQGFKLPEPRVKKQPIRKYFRRLW